MQKLPIGIQTFSKIREDNYIYIDKTKEALELIQNYEYVFLSRPRRFGKSLFVSTLKAIFEGKRELFKGLYIYDKYDFPNYPVIKISWAGILRDRADIERTAFTILRSNQKKLEIECEEKNLSSGCLKELIEKAADKYNSRVVVLIDEYDKPILDNIEDIERAKEAREFLKGFYSVLKDVDECIRFVFITGVSRFSKVSIFSGLNNLEDISLKPKFAYICGYLHRDLEKSFKEHLEDADLEEVKKWYNGYNFLGDERVYNPFDILLFIRNNCEFKNYWFESGTPSFLIKLFQEQTYNPIHLEGLETDEKIVSSFDIERLEVETIMFQAGYLTIKDLYKELDDTTYILSFPNHEVRKSFNDYLLDYLFFERRNKISLRRKLYHIFLEENLDDLEEILKSLFASIAYTNYIKNGLSKYEGFYGSILYAYLTGAGFDVIAEDITSHGRIDLSVILNDKVYIFEFKVKPEDPIKQIKDKKYFEKYLNFSKVYGIGIVFDNEMRNIKSFKVERLR